MPFSRENFYNNRYKPSDKYFEWRNIPGEVPQAAELNEIQSLLKDLVQRAGDTVLQNGDVVEGLAVTPDTSGNDPTWSASVQNYKTLSGKIWIDGAVHILPENITGLSVPNAGWGFIGAYLHKQVITSVDDPDLLDPAITDAQGNYLGLSGANRLKITPVWVAGYLPTSPFDDQSVKDMDSVVNSTNNSVPLIFDLDTTTSLSGDSIYNAKVVIPSAYASDTSFKGFNAFLKTAVNIQPGTKFGVSLKISSAGNGPIKAYLQLFSGGQPVLAAPAANDQIAITQGTVANIERTITEAEVTSLKTVYSNNQTFQIGLVVVSTAQIPQATAAIYISDLSLRTDSLRRPPYKAFKTLLGSQYRSFMVSNDGFIKHGNYSGSGTANTVQPAGLSSTTLLSSVRPIAGIDSVIRTSEITVEEAEAFFETHDVSIEEGKVRIYPIHITYNGQIVSSLPNREYTKLTTNLLADQFSATVPTSIISGFDLTPGSGTSVTIKAGKAFVAGRLFTTTDYSITLPALGNSDVTVSSSIPETIRYDKGSYSSAADAYKVLRGSFKKLNAVTVSAVFTEIVTANQSALENPFADPTLGPETLDTLTYYPLDILDISDSTGTVYERGLDWDIIPKNTGSGNNQRTVAVLGWYLKTATDSTRASRKPQTATYTVTYSARITLDQPTTNDIDNTGNNAPSSTHIKYYRNGTSTVFTSFELKTTTNNNNVTVLDGSTFNGVSLPSTVTGPVLYAVPKPGWLVPFSSVIEIYNYTIPTPGAYILYFDGNVNNSGPDGAFGYVTLENSSTDTQVKQSKELLLKGNLPLGMVTLNPVAVTSYNIRSISLNEQQLTNDRVAEVTKILPALLHQALIGTDIDSSGRTYTDGSNNASEYKRLKTVTSSIDENIFPTLKGYKVALEYIYVDDNYTNSDSTITNALTTAINSYGNSGYPSAADAAGLLRGIIADVKDSTNTSVKKMLLTVIYDDQFNVKNTNSVILA